MSFRRLLLVIAAFGLIATTVLISKKSEAAYNREGYQDIKVSSSTDTTFTLSWRSTALKPCNAYLHLGSNYTLNYLVPSEDNSSGKCLNGAATSYSHSATISKTTLVCNNWDDTPDADNSVACPAGQFLQFDDGNTYFLEILNSADDNNKSGRLAFFFGDVSISGISVSNITPSSAVINFTTDYNVCSSVHYGANSAALSTTAEECDIEANNYNPTKTHHVTLSGLDFQTKYSFTVSVFDNNQTVSPMLDFTTTVPTISNFNINSVTDTSATIHWDTDIPTCGKLVYADPVPSAPKPTKTDTCVTQADASTSHDIALSGLQTGVVYGFDVVYYLPCGTRCNLVTLANQGFRSDGGSGSTGGNSSTSSITAVNIVSTSSSTARISFSYSSAQTSGLFYIVNYGTTAKYNVSIPSQPLTGGAGNKSFIISSLAAGTNYHFSIQLDGSGGKVLATSADRTFSTSRDTSNGGLFQISNVRVDCVDKSCTVFFSTDVASRVEVKWNSATIDNYDASLPSANEVSTTPITGTRSIVFPTNSQNPLVANTEYHYRLRATSAANEISTTGDLKFRTSASAHDHTFATGKCTTANGSVDVGGCIGDQYCQNANDLVQDCRKCGYVCAAGSTCRPSTPAFCKVDSSLTGAASQCNESSCYGIDGRFKTPADAKCYSSWPRCNSNTILKVQKDRGCNLWLSCATSIQTEASQSAPADNLCLNLGACNSLNSKGQCNHYLPLGQCSNDPLRFCSEDVDCIGGGTCNNPDPSSPTRALQDVTYQTPKDVAQIANLSGNVLTGLDWGDQGGVNVIQGGLPWQLMRQISGDGKITNGDLEYQAPNVYPWITVPVGSTPDSAIKIDFEDRDNSANHVLAVSPVTQTTSRRCSNALGTICTVDADCNPPNTTGTATCTAQGVDVAYSGAATSQFDAQPSEFYYAEAKIRSTNGGNPVVRMQFGYQGYSKFQVTTKDANNNTVTLDTFVKVNTNSAWQRVTIGPIRGMSGSTRLAFVCDDKNSCSDFQVDDVIVKPILQVSTNPSYVTPTCRLYPKNDSPSCDYQDTNGIIYKGWKGYCLEHDSQTGTCLSWWPVDVIKGESSIFGSEKTVGYQDRTPLYMCAETIGTPQLPTNTPTSPHDLRVDPVLFSGYYTDGNTTGPVEELYPGAGDAGLVGVKRGLYLPMTTSIDDASGITYYGQHDGNPCNSVENNGPSREGWQPGFSFCRPNGWPAADQSKTFPATDADKLIHVTDVSNFRVHFMRYNQNGDSSWDQLTGTGDVILNAENNWTNGRGYPPYGTGCAGEEFSLQWDPNDGHLVSYHFYAQRCGNDPRSASGFWAVGLFLMKDRCSEVVQVVDTSGKNAAFAQRVTSLGYKVPDLNYTLSTDLKPYGGSVAPAISSDDPEKWPLLSAEAPNYVVQKAPGQSRSGSPYACIGDCSMALCTSNNDITCSDPNGPKKCQEYDGNNDSIPDGGECIGVGSANASSKGNQQFADTLRCVKVPNSPNSYCGGAITCSTAILQQCTATLSVTAKGPTYNETLLNAGNACGFSPRIAATPDGHATAINGTAKGLACNGSVASCNGTTAYYTDFRATLNTAFAATDPQRYVSCTRGGQAVDANTCQSAASGCVCTVTGNCSSSMNFNQGTVNQVNSGSVCISDSSCQNVASSNAYFSQERIRRLFAQSFAIYTNKRCSNDMTRTCMIDANCVIASASPVSGRCEPSQQTYTKIPDSVPGAGDTFVGWNPPAKLCPDNPAANGPACSSVTKLCSASKVVVGTTQEATKDAAILAALQQCGLKTTGAPILNDSRVVTNATQDATSTIVACDGVEKDPTTNVATCPGVTGLYDAGTKVPFTSMALTTPCSLKNGTWTCTGRCTSDKEYISAGKTAASTAARYLRPTYLAGSNADYCAIPPTITNAKFTTGTAATAVISGGSGSVSIKFNTNADQEQIPLGKIRIDWGDAQNDFEFPYAPRSDSAHPHIFSHTYAINRLDTEHCTPFGNRTTCTYPIKIQVQDSWGWCNDATRTTTSSDNKCQGITDGNGRIDSTAWFDTGLTVNVQP